MQSIFIINLLWLITLYILHIFRAFPLSIKCAICILLIVFYYVYLTFMLMSISQSLFHDLASSRFLHLYCAIFICSAFSHSTYCIISMFLFACTIGAFYYAVCVLCIALFWYFILFRCLFHSLLVLILPICSWHMLCNIHLNYGFIVWPFLTCRYCVF